MGKQLAAMLDAKRSAGVTPEVNLREHIQCMPPPSVNKAAHSAFETQRRHHKKSEQGHLWPHKQDLCPQKIFLKTCGKTYNVIEIIEQYILIVACS